MVAPRGAYFIANDRILDLAITFLNSFRAHNPDIPLCLVPFDARFERVARMQGAYGFTVFPRLDVCAACDRISERFHSRTRGVYRKLAMWEGDFQEFVYIDADTVVLRDVSFAFDHLAEHDFITSHSNMPSLVRWVWKPSIHETGRLTGEQIAYSANTGFLVSRRGALALKDVERRLDEVAAVAPHMALGQCPEQPVLNYLIVTSGRRYTSLSELSRTGARPGLPAERWAGTRGGRIEGGRIVFEGDPTPVLLVHWAGQWQPTRWDYWRYRLLKLARLVPPDAIPPVRLRLRYRRLWRHYRRLRERAGA